MIKERYTIIAMSPDGKTVQSVGRKIQSIRKIKSAMESNGYTDIRIFKKAETSPHVLFAKGLKAELNCSPKTTVDIYRKMMQIMEEQGLEFNRKEVSVDA